MLLNHDPGIHRTRFLVADFQKWEHDTISMRVFATTALTSGAVLNGCLGYCGQNLADRMRMRLETYGATVPAVTVLALALPPWFYVTAVAALLCAVLGLRHVITESWMLYAAFGLLLVDIAILLTSHFAFTHAAIRM
jgi:hypothetical protein